MCESGALICPLALNIGDHLFGTMTQRPGVKKKRTGAGKGWRNPQVFWNPCEALHSLATSAGFALKTRRSGRAEHLIQGAMYLNSPQSIVPCTTNLHCCRTQLSKSLKNTKTPSHPSRQIKVAPPSLFRSLRHLEAFATVDMDAEPCQKKGITSGCTISRAWIRGNLATNNPSYCLSPSCKRT